MTKLRAIDAKEKTCKKCEETLSTKEFYTQKQVSPNGIVCEYYDSLCKECRKKYSSERRKKYKLKAIEYKGGKCVDCLDKYDGKNACIFDFHHLRDKEFNISGLLLEKSMIKLKVEADKCVLLCANCHRKRTIKGEY